MVATVTKERDEADRSATKARLEFGAARSRAGKLEASAAASLH